MHVFVCGSNRYNFRNLGVVLQGYVSRSNQTELQPASVPGLTEPLASEVEGRCFTVIAVNTSHIEKRGAIG
jgi:hypothetical protein